MVHNNKYLHWYLISLLIVFAHTQSSSDEESPPHTPPHLRPFIKTVLENAQLPTQPSPSNILPPTENDTEYPFTPPNSRANSPIGSPSKIED